MNRLSPKQRIGFAVIAVLACVCTMSLALAPMIVGSGLAA
jgi:hypothetical protein